MENPVTEVPLRKRSTPYDFDVDMLQGANALRVYGGKSAEYATNAYWQAVRTAVFLGFSGTVRIQVVLAGTPYGEFSTELEAGKIKSLHAPAGGCIEWTKALWSQGNIYEKLVATPAPSSSPKNSN